MIRVVEFYSRLNDFRGGVKGLPSWGFTIISLLAIPGLVLIALSILALGISIAALLILTVPVYRVLRRITSPVAGVPYHDGMIEARVVESATGPTRRPIEVKIIEP